MKGNACNRKARTQEGCMGDTGNKNRMKNLLPAVPPLVLFTWILAFFFPFFFAPPVPGQEELRKIEIPSSVNPVGSGARALGMGGAFIAVCDDATASSWNPSGLVQLETPEFSVVGAWFDRFEENRFSHHPEGNAGHGVQKNRINFLSFACPAVLWDHHLVFSISYQHLFDFTREWDFGLVERTDSVSAGRKVHFSQDGGLSAIGLSCGMEITPKLSLGLTVNFWEDSIRDNQWKETRTESWDGVEKEHNIRFVYDTTTTDTYSFSGMNFNLGGLFRITPALTLGMVVKTPFSADIIHESRYETKTDFPGASPGAGVSSAQESLDMPLSFGIGIACRFTDRFTLSGDIYRTQWGDYLLTDADGYEISPLTGKPHEEADVSDTHQVRLGMEYLFYSLKKTNPVVIPLHFGVFYDPMPAEGSPDDSFGVSLGTGFARGPFVFDLACQYRFANDIRTFIMEGIGFSQDTEEYTVYASVIFHL